jgi:hypothetical protein
MAIRQMVFDDHRSVRKITEIEVNLTATYSTDRFPERTFQIDAGMQVSRFVAFSVFSIRTDKTARYRPKAFPVGIVEGRGKFFADEF